MNFRPEAHKRRASTVIDMTALVDVVFQLLIFFLLTSNYVAQTAQSSATAIDLELPESDLQAENLPVEELTISIDAAGTIFVNDEAITSRDELTQRLVEAAAHNPNTIVFLRGDRDVSYGRIAEIISLCRMTRLKVSAVLKSQ